MLSPDEADSVGNATLAAYAETEIEMLIAAAERMLDLTDASDVAERLTELTVKLHAIAESSRASNTTTMRRELADAASTHLEREMSGLGINEEVGASILVSVREKSAAFMLDAITASNAMTANMAQSASRSYLKYSYEAASHVRAGLLSPQEAFGRAISKMAAEGIDCMTYFRKDGTEVHIPVDVGVRRIIGDTARGMYDSETLMVMEATGDDLVEVSSHIGARPSHAEWQGQIYSYFGKTPGYELFSKACLVGDMVDGYGGYNCRHTFGIWREGDERRYDSDPTPKGYTNEQAYTLRQEQRRHESAIRRLERQIRVLESQNLDTAKQEDGIREHKEAIRKLVRDNPKVLRREAERERIDEGF